MPITPVPNTDTPNAGRVKWNDSDASLQAEIDAAEAALTTHKTSADHDGRYYTEAESDARFAALSHTHDDRYYTETESDARYIQQNSAADIVVKKATPALELQHSDGSKLLRLGATSTPEPDLVLQGWVQGVWRTLLRYLGDSGKVEIPSDDLYVRDLRVATEDYVNQRVRSGSAFMCSQTDVLTIGSSGYIKNGTATQVFVLPQNSILTSIVLGLIDPTSTWKTTVAVPPTDITTAITIEIVNGSTTGTVRVRSATGTGQLTWFTGSFTAPNLATAYSVTLIVSV